MLISSLPELRPGVGWKARCSDRWRFHRAAFALAAAALLAISEMRFRPWFVAGCARVRCWRGPQGVAIDVYRPILRSLLDRPGILAWILGVTFLVGLAPVGSAWLYRGALLAALVTTACCVPRWPMRMAALASLVVVGLAAQQWMMPLEREFLTPLDEGMVMDMPTTIPAAPG